MIRSQSSTNALPSRTSSTVLWKPFVRGGREIVPTTTSPQAVLVLWSNPRHVIYFIELTVSWEDAFDEANERKRLRSAQAAGVLLQHAPASGCSKSEESIEKPCVWPSCPEDEPLGASSLCSVCLHLYSHVSMIYNNFTDLLQSLSHLEQLSHFISVIQRFSHKYMCVASTKRVWNKWKRERRKKKPWIQIYFLMWPALASPSCQAIKWGNRLAFQHRAADSFQSPENKNTANEHLWMLLFLSCWFGHDYTEHTDTLISQWTNGKII